MNIVIFIEFIHNLFQKYFGSGLLYNILANIQPKLYNNDTFLGLLIHKIYMNIKYMYQWLNAEKQDRLCVVNIWVGQTRRLRARTNKTMVPWVFQLIYLKPVPVLLLMIDWSLIDKGEG